MTKRIFRSIFSVSAVILVISIGLITAAALIPAKPVPSPAPMPAKNVTKSVNKNVMLISISEQLVAKRR